MSHKWEPLRPFYMERAAEQITNGVWTIECFYFNTGNHLSPQARFESPGGNSMWAYWDSQSQCFRALEDMHLVPLYVRAKANTLGKRVFN